MLRRCPFVNVTYPIIVPSIHLEFLWLITIQCRYSFLHGSGCSILDNLHRHLSLLVRHLSK